MRLLSFSWTASEVKKLFKTIECFQKLWIVQQIEMCAQQIMHAFDIMCRFNRDHRRFLVK